MKLTQKTLLYSFILTSSLSLFAKDYVIPSNTNTIEHSTVKKSVEPVAVEFSSIDGLAISGNLYEIDKSKPVILLCHQAGFNKTEYAEIAPKLNELGFNCLAIDQRSGGNLEGTPNETSKRAKAKNLPTRYVDAQQDIEAAISYLNEKFNQKVIVWGSSYSSSFALFESLKNDKVKASISFSPGNYFGSKRQSLEETFSKLEKPFFVTSSKSESKKLSSSINVNELKENQIQFIPNSGGFHGSKALWSKKKGNEEYWAAITQFLNSLTGK